MRDNNAYLIIRGETIDRALNAILAVYACDPPKQTIKRANEQNEQTIYRERISVIEVRCVDVVLLRLTRKEGCRRKISAPVSAR